MVTKSFKLKEIPLDMYFNLGEEETSKYQYDNNEIRRYIYKNADSQDFYIEFKDNEMLVTGSEVNQEKILKLLRDYYENNQYHITRMFGSYILIKGNQEKLEAIKATEIPIKFCPLMVKLLKDVCEELGGELINIVDELLRSLEDEDKEKQITMMCKLINEVVIKGSYFDTNRPLNSCEANVPFGASETIASAFNSDLVDAAVIVSNNLGTIITTNNSNTQGAVKRMTGLFFTSPSEKIMQTAWEAGIIPVFLYTAEIDQMAGVKKAIEMGYKKIAVSVAARDNYLHEELKQLEEEHGIVIYKFGLCSTGIDEETALKMRDNADVIWSCASKQVKEYVEPKALAQVGIRIPVHIMSKRGWEIVENHLKQMPNEIDFDEIELCQGDAKPIILMEQLKYP